MDKRVTGECKRILDSTVLRKQSSIMNTNQTCICQYCIANINEVGTISEAEYAVASNAHSCTFCFCEYPEPFVLKDDSLENITRLKKLLKESSDKYEHTTNYH